MRNLRSTHRSVLWCPDNLQLTALCWDVATNTIICAFGPTKDNILIELKRWDPIAGSPEPCKKTLEHISSWDAPCPLPDLECDCILDLHHFSDSSTICLVLTGGDIIVVRETPSYQEEKIEIVGSVDVGIAAAAWSPDEELLAITTRSDTLLFMTREFENVVSVSFSKDDLQASKHVSVGWGKSETQFKGRGAKALRDPTIPEKVDEGTLSHLDDCKSSVSWRGDGAYVAVNSIQPGSRRVIRVYSREGSLDSASEPVDNLEGALSWRPAGNLLAGIQRFDDHIDVVFFERNGLRHGHFGLRLDKKDMNDWATNVMLKWNVDSSILAIVFKDRAQLWTMGNYHYYLKQEIPLPYMSNLDSYPTFAWHPEQSTLFAIGSSESLQTIQYVYHVAHGSMSPPNDYGVIAVIDGKILKMASLRLANVPPPMALQEIEASSNIIDATVCGNEADQEALSIAILEQARISIYSWNTKRKPSMRPSLMSSTTVQNDSDGLSNQKSTFLPQQIILWNNNRILVLASQLGASTLYLFNYDPTTHATTLVESFSRPLTQYILTEVSGTKLLPYRLDAQNKMTEELLLPNSPETTNRSANHVVAVFPKRVAAVAVLDINYHKGNEISSNVNLLARETIAFGLTQNGSLFANERRLAADCTSFLITPAHLIYTTAQHLLKFVHMTKVEDLQIPPDTPEADERCRSIERGARLVTVIPSISALVLQMPRGNLETVYPRALVVATIRQSINQKQYKDAFLACRSHRVDMNILHDHAPQDFLANVGLFVDQIKKVEYLDLFLSQLREEDVSRTMYQETIRTELRASAPKYLDDTPLRSIVTASKVNRICNAFLEILQNKLSTNLQNIITAHICKIPPDLEAGLLVVAQFQKEDLDLAENAVQHICFLADVNRLYDIALGLYNLDLVLLIAQQSQKDPREYLPFLQSLEELTILRRHYTIDNHLGRYVKALKHLQDLGASTEFKTYMTRHELFKEALHLYRYEEDKIREIMRVYAHYLQTNSKYKEAGIAFEYLKEYTSASNSYRLAHLWRESLFCATLVPFPDTQLQSLARTISDSLQELKDFYSAAIIHQEYLHDVASGARLFCKGYFFADALRILSLHKSLDLIEPVIDTGLVDGMATMTELLAECKAQIHAQVPRIRELRLKKAEEPLAFFDGDANGGADIPDNVSLAPTNTSTSGGTLFTRYTNQTGTVGTGATRRTSKNRRREERKRARGKKGSVYEEEYLVNSVGRLIDRINAVRNEVERLIVGLMRRGMRERARAVEGAMVEVVSLCKECLGEVFEAKGEKGAEEIDGGVETDRPVGSDGVAWDSLQSVQARKELPIVKDFEKLSIFEG